MCSILEATFENDGNIEALLNQVLWEPTSSSSPTTEKDKVVPYFDEMSTQLNITVQIGANVDLHCKVNHLNEKTVSIFEISSIYTQIIRLYYFMYLGLTNVENCIYQ